MTFAVDCADCDETVWPPVEAIGPGGRSEIAALRLALQHTRETGHTTIEVIPGCYYVGAGAAPTAFGDGATDPEDVRSPDRAELARSVETAGRTLRTAADRLDEDRGLPPSRHADHLRRMAENVDKRAAHYGPPADGGRDD